MNERRVCIKSLQIRRRESSVRDAKESDDEINVPKREDEEEGEEGRGQLVKGWKRGGNAGYPVADGGAAFQTDINANEYF